jgi:hypothetical protein
VIERFRLGVHTTNVNQENVIPFPLDNTAL